MKKSAVAILICVFLLLSGCKAEEAKKSCTVLAMDTVMTLTAYGGKAESALLSAQSLINSLDSQLSATNESSETSAINKGAGQPVSVLADTEYLINTALSIGDSTGGALDISLTPVIEAWGFLGGDYRVPTDSELQALLENVDYSRINCADGAVSMPENMSISFGAIAKGYTSDMVIADMEKQGITSAVISLGGNVQTLGLKPDGEKWNVAVQSPFDDGYLATIKVEDKAVITSGGYERYFVGDDGQIYWHILDPETGKPAQNGLVSVTIISDSGILADGLSTALFVMGLDEAAEYWRQNGVFDAIFVTEDSEVYITSGIENDFALTEENQALALTVIS